MAVDTARFAGHLSAFLHLVERVVSHPADAAWHLGYPAGSGTLVGSETGRALWESPEAQDLVECLLEDPLLSSWFKPHPEFEFTELRFFLCSVTDAWVSSGEPVEGFAANHADTILRVLAQPVQVGTTILIAYGLEIAESIALPYGLGMAPATAEAFNSLMGDVPTDLLRVPDVPAVLLVRRGSATRTEMGAIAATFALSTGYPTVRWVREAVWLATGIRLGIGHTLDFHESPYPVPPIRVPPRPEEEWPLDCDPTETASVESSLLWQITARLGSIWGVEGMVADEGTHQALRTTHLYVPLALDSADARMTMLLSYAAIDGLLLERTDHHSRLGPRLAWLLGRSSEERTRIRKLMQHMYGIRGAFAHGEILELNSVSALLGRDLAQIGDDLRIQGEVQRGLRTISLALLRRTLIAFLWLAFDVDAPAADPSTAPFVRPALTRDEILDRLEAAAANKLEAQTFLDEHLPPAAGIWEHSAAWP